MPCHAGCGTSLPRHALAAHLASECPDAEVECPFAGCGARTRRADAPAHAAESLEAHLAGERAARVQTERRLGALERTVRMLSCTVAAHARQQTSVAAQLQAQAQAQQALYAAEPGPLSRRRAREEPEGGAAALYVPPPRAWNPRAYGAASPFGSPGGTRAPAAEAVPLAVEPQEPVYGYDH
jgi:hypothetical protein